MKELRDIFQSSLTTEKLQIKNLADAIRSHIEPLGGVDLKISPREAMPEPLSFDE